MVSCAVGRATRLVDTVLAPTATVRTAADFVVLAGEPGIAVARQESPTVP